MKNLIIVLTLLFQSYLVSYTQVITVSNQPNTPGEYSSIQDAINAANPGDTLLIHGANYSAITVNKPLTLIGPGDCIQGQFPIKAWIPSITLDSTGPTSTASGSKFISLNIGYISKKPIDQYQINNIVVERCHISTSLSSHVLGDNWIIRNNVFYWNSTGGTLDINNNNNLLVSNIVFHAPPTAYQISNSDKSSVVIANNIFTGHYDYSNQFKIISNAYFSGNIFFGKSPQGATNSIFENNITYGNLASNILPYGTNTGINNWVNTDPLFVNVPNDNSKYEFSCYKDYNLQPGSPGYNILTNEQLVGIFGGAFPMPAFDTYIIAGHPPLPQVYFLQLLSNLVSTNIPIDVMVKVRKNDGAPIYTGEYFYDIDPGVGNGIPLSLFSPTADTTLSLQIFASFLQPGPHLIYFRFKDTLEKWGLHARMDFISCDVLALANFVADTVCLGQDSTSFVNLSTGGDTNTIYKWDMTGDGVDDVTHTGIIGTGAPLQFKYKFLTGGIHNVRLITDNGGGCKDTVFKQVLISNPSVGGAISLSHDTICFGSTVLMTLSGYSGTIQKWQWSYGNTNNWFDIPNSDQISIAFLPDTVGTWYIRAIVKNGICDTAHSVINSFYADTQSSAAPLAPSAINGPSNVCINTQAVMFTVGTMANANTYHWTLPQGATILSGAGTHTILVNFSQNAISGNITVYASNLCGNGPISVPHYVAVNQLPYADAGTDQFIIHGATTVLQGSAGGGSGNYTYTWIPDTLLTNPNSLVTNTTNLINSITFSLLVTDNVTGCMHTSNMQVIVIGGVLTATASAIPSIICENNPVQLDVLPQGGSGYYSYEWYESGNSVSFSTLKDPIVYPSQTISYTVWASDNITSDMVSCSVTVTVNPLPDSAATIIGPVQECIGQQAQYSVPPITNATGYQWELPPGVIIQSGYNTNSIMVHFTPNATSGSISVFGSNACGYGMPSSIAVTVHHLPDDATTIIGPTQVCQGQQVIFSVPPISGATDYLWILPMGATIQSGFGTNSVFVLFNSNSTSGMVSVNASNACGQGASSSIFVTVNPIPNVSITPSQDTTITCYTSVTFYGAVTGGSSPITIQWTPAVLLTSPNSVSTSTVNLQDTTVFTFTVTDSLGCTSSIQATVNVPCSPLIATALSSPATICEGDSSTLNVNCSGGAQPYSYAWSSNPGTFFSVLQNPVVNPTVTTSYTVTVSGGGQTTTATAIVNVNPLPEPAGTISGPSVVYFGQTGINYSVPIINYATGYIWTLPQGFGIVSGNNTNSIFVDVSVAAVSGNVSVYGINNCGLGDSSALYPVTIATGIAESEDTPISIYPNPTNGKVFVRINCNNKEKITVRLYNQFGMLIFEEETAHEPLHTYDFSFISGGLYYLHVYGTTINKTVKVNIQK
ncbi:MAG: hypothetical protein PHT69_10070 [Bacteroidales bacterium]|nr:hypothetical protein [Bacteroidales bacterium]